LPLYWRNPKVLRSSLPGVAMRDKYGRWISFRPLISLGGLD
jgi:hypothetical protein